MDQEAVCAHIPEGADAAPDNGSEQDREGCESLLTVSEEQQQFLSSVLALSNVPPPVDTADDKLMSESNVFLCGVCSSAFSSIEKCNLHVIQDHSDQVTKTPGSNPEKSSSSVVASGSGAEVLKCSESGCHYAFSKEKLSIHAACHAPGNMFRCCESGCSATFGKWRSCALHLWNRHSVDMDLLSCPVCHSYKTIWASRLDKHVQVHSSQKSFNCGQCGKSFKQLAQLKNHSVIHLDKDSEAVPAWHAKKKCPVCQKLLADSKCLKKHVQAVHSKLKPYICHVCNHQSARKSMLEMHIRQHTGEKPYSCTSCDYRTADHNSLRRHQMRHLGKKPYQCPFCSYAFIQSADYKKHILGQHSDRLASEANVFLCTQCPFRSVNFQHFIDHQLKHSSQEPDK